MADERIVAGMSCSEVLAVLSDFLDGELDAAARERVAAHLKGCDWCERFGGRFGDLVAAFRRELKQPEPLAADMVSRLRDAIERAGERK